MLKRRNAVLAFLLVAVMLLGVGFAAMVDELEVTGKASSTILSDGDGEPNEENATPAEKKFMAEVYFVTTDSVDGVTITQPAAKADTFSFVVAPNKLQNGGDSVTIKAKIMNESDYKVNVAPVVEGNKEFSVAVGTAKEIAVNSTGEFDITVSLTTSPLQNIDEETFTVTYTVSAIQG